MTSVVVSLPATVRQIQVRPLERYVGASGLVTIAEQDHSLAAGAATLALDPTSTDWCWVFTEHGPGGVIRFCSVPDVVSVNYADLVDVEPATFVDTNAGPAETAWRDGLLGVSVSADAALSAASTAQSAAAAAQSASTSAQAGVTSARSIAATSAANTYRLLAKMARGVEDASILVIGDSTGNESAEWVRLWIGDFAARFPAYTVVYHLWDATGDAGYDTGSAPAAVTVQTGTGSQTLHLWNFAVSGSKTSHCLAGRWALGIVPTNPDLVMISHGHNEGALANGVHTWLGQYLALTESVAEEHPQAAICCIMQNPETANSDQQRRAVRYQQIAAAKGYGVIDVQRAFLDTGNFAAWTKVDGVHPTTSADAPSPNGSRLWADVVLAATDPSVLAATSGGGAVPQQPSSLSVPGEQIAVNGSFAAFSSAVPDSWTAIGCTTAKDQRAGWFESRNGYAVRVQATGAAQSLIQQDVANYAAYKGKWVTLAVRQRVAAAQASTAGRIGLNDGFTSALSVSTFNARDGFMWQVVSLKLSASALRLRVYLYGNTSADAAADVTYDSVHLVLGALPRRAIG